MGEELDSEIRPQRALDAEARRQLASLGYLGGGGGGGRVGGDLPDPRAMTALAERLHQAAREAEEGKCEQALPDLQRMAEQDPHDFTVLSLAGECLRDLDRPEAALALFRRAAAENPASAAPVASVAGSLLALGRDEEAIGEYRRALTLDPTQSVAAANLAQLLRGKGDLAGALRVLDVAVAGGSHAAAVFTERGLALAESNRLSEALDSFREAMRHDAADPVPVENAAHAAFQLDRLKESAQLYEEALRRAPDRGDLWKTLGSLYLNLDDRPDALRAFARALPLETDAGERAKLEDVIRELNP